MWRQLLTALFVAGAAPSAAQPVDRSNAITVTIELDGRAITPERLILYAGQPYRLHFVNTSSRTHNFFSPRFFRAATIAPGESAVVDGEVELRTGQSAIVNLVPPDRGEFRARCTHLLHDLFGETADIEVLVAPALSGGEAQ